MKFFNKINDIFSVVTSSKNTVLIKILISYIIIGSVLLSTLSTLIYKKFSESSMEEINNITEKIVEQSYRVTDTMWVSTYKYLYQEFFTDNIVINALSNKHIDTTDYRQISQRLSDVVNGNNFVYSIYVYNTQAGVVFSNMASMTDIVEFPEKNFVESLINNYKDDNPLILYRTLKPTLGVATNEINVITVAFIDEKLRSALVFNLDQRVLQNIITEENSDNSNQILIVNKYGKVIAHSLFSMVNRNVSNEDYYKRIQSVKDVQGYFSTEIDTSKSLITFKKWDTLGWTFINIGDYNKLLHRTSKLQSTIVLWTILFILLSVVIAGFFAHNIYKPLYNLLKRVKSDNRDNTLGRVNEYDVLSNIYDSYKNQIVDLQSNIRNNKTIVKKELLNQLLHGEIINPQDVAQQLQDTKIRLNSKKYQVIVLRLDNASDVLSRFSSNDMSLFRFAICNITEEIFNETLNSEVVESGEDTISIIVNINDDMSEIQSLLNTTLSNVQAALDKFLNFSVTAGLGSVVEETASIYISFKDALNVTNYRLVYGQKSILNYSILANVKHEVYVYPLDLEKKIIDCIRSGDENKAMSSLEEFINNVSRFSYDEILLAMTQLALFSIRYIENTGFRNDLEYDNLNLDFKAINNLFASYDTLENIKKWFVSLFEKVLDSVKKKKDDRYDEVIHKITTYIDENYSDANLNVDTISDVVNFSSNYLREIFKERTGKTISGYLTDLRFEKAKEQLLNSNYPANKIAEMVGLPGKTYFYTAFKKAIGKSPDEYRKEHKS